MAEASDPERTEPASPKRLQEARERGQVPRSPELTTFSVLLIAGVILVFSGSSLMHGLLVIVRDGLIVERDGIFRTDLLSTRLFDGLMAAIVALAPLFIAVVVVAIIAPITMSGWLFSWNPLQPNFSKLDPFAGLARLFSVKGWVEMGKAILKTLILGGIATVLIWNHRDELVGLLYEPLGQGLSHVGTMTGAAFLVIVAGMGIIVAVDVPYQLWSYHQDLRMTKDEIKQELREQEGTPEIKGRVRQLQRESARKRMMAEVPKADVVVTNPTRFAVALRYRDRSMRAPEVVAKGSLELAERIREVALEAGVPILSAPPLARALFRHTEIGQEIPAALYTAVAEVLAYVYQLRRYESAGGDAPTPPRDISVPANLDPEQTLQ